MSEEKGEGKEETKYGDDLTDSTVMATRERNEAAVKVSELSCTVSFSSSALISLLFDVMCSNTPIHWNIRTYNSNTSVIGTISHD